jgi:hypothetical protein
VHGAELASAFADPSVAVTIVPSDGGVSIIVPAGIAEGTWRLVLRDDSPCLAVGNGWLSTHDDWVAWSTTFGPSDPVLYVQRDDGTTAQADVVASGGNPGGALDHSEAAGGSVWYFVSGWGWPSWDLGAIRFDLRATGSGLPAPGPGIVLRAGAR